MILEHETSIISLWSSNRDYDPTRDICQGRLTVFKESSFMMHLRAGGKLEETFKAFPAKKPAYGTESFPGCNGGLSPLGRRSPPLRPKYTRRSPRKKYR